MNLGGYNLNIKFLLTLNVPIPDKVKKLRPS